MIAIILDLFVKIDDYKDLFSTNAKINAQTDTVAINDTLKEAIQSFIVAASIKKARGINGYNSMLIHIARFKNPATTLRPLVSEYIDELYHNFKYRYDITIEDFKNFWVDKFEPISLKRLGNDFKDDWNKIKDFLLPTIESIQMNIKVINGDW